MTLDELLALVRAEIGDRPLTLEQFRILICSKAPGERVYIKERKDCDVTHRDTPKTLQRRHGIARSTAYNWINRYKR